MGSGVVLEVRDLRRIVNDRVVIANLSFDVRSGEVLFVHGPKGVGKTLLLRLLAYLDPIQGGSLLLNGQTPEQVGIAAWRTQVAFVCHHRPPLKGTPSESYFAIQRFKSQRGRPRGDLPALIADLGLEQTLLNVPWADLTDDQALRVRLAVAIALCPDILLVDEPTATCNSHSAFRVEQLLKSCGRAVVWVTSDQQQPERVGGRILSLPLGTQTLVLAGGQRQPQQQLAQTPGLVVPRPPTLQVVADDDQHFLYSPTDMLSPRTAYSDTLSQTFSQSEAELADFQNLAGHFNGGTAFNSAANTVYNSPRAGSPALTTASTAYNSPTLGAGSTTTAFSPREQFSSPQEQLFDAALQSPGVLPLPLPQRRQ